MWWVSSWVFEPLNSFFVEAHCLAYLSCHPYGILNLLFETVYYNHVIPTGFLF